MKNTHIKHQLSINNKKYQYTLSPKGEGITHVTCEAAKVDQDFLNEDLANLLNDLPSLIIAEKNYKKSQSEIIRFRVSTDDKKLIEKTAARKGYTSVSSYLRDLSLK